MPIRSKQKSWFVFIGLALLAKASFFFIKHQSFLYFWDYLGHLQDSINISWPWIGGWSNFYWGGYPTVLYPPLSHWLLKILTILTPSPKVAMAVFILLSLGLLSHALWKLSKKLLNNLNLQLLAFATSILFYVLSPVNSLVSLKGTLFSGTITATLAISFLIYFLASEKWHRQGFWLGVLFLTHALTASLGVFFMLIQLMYLLLYPIKEKAIKVKNWLYSFLLASFIGLPWILSFLDQNFQHTAFNITGKIFPLSLVCLILLGVSLVIQLINKKSPSKFFIFTLFIGIASVLPLWVTKIIEQHFIRGVHFYRYYSFLIILTPTVLLAAQDKLSQRITSKVNYSFAKIISGLTIIITLFIPLTPFSYRFKTHWDRTSTIKQGRVIDTANMSEIDLFTRTADHLLTANTNLLGSFGLFFESSSTGMNYAVAKYLLNSDSYGVPVYKIYIEELAKKISADQDYLLDLLGINYQAYTSPNKDEIDAINFAMVEIRAEKKGLHRQNYYHLKKINNTQLVEALSAEVEFEPNLNLWDWWTNPDRKMSTRENPLPPISINYDQPSINNLQIEADMISFSVDSPAPAPIYLKFSYSPYWQATTTNEADFTSQPLWITPGNMMIYAKGDILLRWITPPYLKTFAPISLATLIGTAIIMVIEKISKEKNN